MHTAGVRDMGKEHEHLQQTYATSTRTGRKLQLRKPENQSCRVHTAGDCDKSWGIGYFNTGAAQTTATKAGKNGSYFDLLGEFCDFILNVIVLGETAKTNVKLKHN